MVNMISLIINGEEFQTHSGVSILDACKSAGVFVPRFCYHETLSIAGNCRMCLVEVEGVEKPVASCLTEVSDNMIVYTESIFAQKARENVLETLLLNHPLDCPVCDQAGECDLQDQTKSFASTHSKYFFNKRGVEDKNCGVLIQTIMTRCIHCTRCVRFSSEIAGVDFFGTFNRGTSTEIGGYADDFFRSEISGNVIDLCPVGALTSKNFGFKARPWELRVNESIDTTDSTGSNIYIYFKDKAISRILPKSNENINGQIITDAARFSYDSSITDRLRHIFIYNDNVKKERSINWTKFFKKTDTFISTEKLLFNVNDDIGLENIETITKLSRHYKNVTLTSTNGRYESDNLYQWGLNDKIKSIDECDSLGLAFSVNSKVECAAINARIRTRCLNSLLSFISMNMNYAANIPNKNINLNLSKSLRVIEGKYTDYAIKLNLALSPLIMMGESFKKRGLTFKSITNFLKAKFNTVKTLQVNVSANSESLSFLNVKNLFRRQLLQAKKLMCLNLDNVLKIRKTFCNLNENVFWFNTHKYRIKSKINTSIPIFSDYEDEKVLINLEQRPQKLNNTFKKYFDSRSLKRILNSIFSIDDKKNDVIFSSNYLTFINEIIKNPWIFDKLENNYALLSLNKIKNINYLLKYPTKYLITNFFTSSKVLKHSTIMSESAKKYWDSNFTL